ncbi:hypothetical protein QVD17_06965 [Tagetes erecta]|uniref:Uncharacterized protein n=1 Tax=Tagetes erecta TaxID=13708 RepID=A0AAD8LGJ5_TARER|nr:hypothetical protein QVD17_06965 [Tagetes erecta]
MKCSVLENADVDEDDRPLRGTSDKIGTIQRRLAWPLRKDDTHKSRNGGCTISVDINYYRLDLYDLPYLLKFLPYLQVFVFEYFAEFKRGVFSTFIYNTLIHKTTIAAHSQVTYCFYFVSYV